MSDRKTVALVIPDSATFSSLQLTRHAQTGDLEFSWAPIEAICEASKLPLETFTQSPEDNTAALIHQLYRIHLDDGGDPHPVMVDLMHEMQLEDAHGGGLSHQPGRA